MAHHTIEYQTDGKPSKNIAANKHWVAPEAIQEAVSTYSNQLRLFALVYFICCTWSWGSPVVPTSSRRRITRREQSRAGTPEESTESDG